jgi:hypothetical protein
MLRIIAGFPACSDASRSDIAISDKIGLSERHLPPPAYVEKGGWVKKKVGKSKRGGRLRIPVKFDEAMAAALHVKPPPKRRVPAGKNARRKGNKK